MIVVHASLGNGLQQLIEFGRFDPIELDKRTAIKVIRQRGPRLSLDLLELVLSDLIVYRELPILC